jgi:predicted metal-dependent phosphoesterase TrpH
MTSGNFDLHCHSTVSDGTLAPADVVRRAAANGVDVLALTDHDETGGLEAARSAAAEHGIRLIPGVEISVSWGGVTIHVLGLGIDAANAALAAGLQRTRSSRYVRAQKMADELAAVGIPGAMEGALAYAENPGLVGRTHFARFLVERGHAKDVGSVFKRYLARGKPGYVAQQWAELGETVAWIRGAGGRAVVAHPGRYALSRQELERFFVAFKEAGGEGIEVVTGSHTRDQFGQFAGVARELGFLASRGSDFHSPDEGGFDLGGIPPLPEDLKPVWHDW